MPTTHPVTDHALARYLERVLRLEAEIDAAVGKNAGDRLRADAGCRIAGITLDEARDLVCPPRLHVGLRIGEGMVRASDRVMPFRDGRVVSCLLPLPKPKPHRPARIAA